jgi:hypothetical protein
MTEDGSRLADIWKVRNAAAESLALVEDQVRKALREASCEELVALLESFSPALSSGPEWTRTFDPLIEHLWAWRDDATMAVLAETFKARGVPWAGVANAFAPEHGASLRTELRHPAWARLPAFTMA